jgi:hypothetical protein
LALISRVESVLWRVVHRCNTVEQAFWPTEVSLKLMAIPSTFAANNGLDLAAASQSKKRQVPDGTLQITRSTLAWIL